MVYIILVNWNGWRDLVECLGSLLGMTFDDFVVIVCDNGSTDGSFENAARWAECLEVSGRSPEVWARLEAGGERPRAIHRLGGSVPPLIVPGHIYWLEMGYNAGFAAANNAGLKLALLDERMTHAWLLNSDTVVHASALSTLMRRMDEPPKADLVGSTLIYYWRPDEVQALGVKFSLASGRGEEIGRGSSPHTLPSQAEVEDRITYVAGASMLVSREFLEDVGLMCEDYFLYFEELDWAIRAHGKFKPGWAKGSIVYHKEGASIGTANGRRASDTSIYYQSVNLLRLLRRHRPIMLPLGFARLTMVMLRHLIRGDAAAAGVVASALLDFFGGRRRTGPILRKGSLP